MCEQRLTKLKNRLTSENLIEKYDEIFKEYEQNKIIEKVPFDEVPKKPGQVHYLPHRPVLREDKETTKIRAALCVLCVRRTPLNNCLYSGPNLLLKIFDILLRFRFNFIAILADIKQAFLNVEISKEHRAFLRFLWYENVNSESDAKLIVYRFLRVVFGVASSPFLLNGTIRHHLSKYLSCDQQFIEKLLEDLYVDDVTSGTKTIEQGKEFYKKAKLILSEAGFDLRKWVTNDSKLQNFLDSQENSEAKILNETDITFSKEQFGPTKNSYKKVLGLEWDIQNDEIVFQFEPFICLVKSLTPTKRNVLKVCASFYDPLGFISPITARIKTIFQLLCKNQCSWDENMSSEIKLIWNDFLADLKQIEIFRMKRFALVQPQEIILSVSLYGFCDSSSQVYCGMVYIRAETTLGIRVSFLCAKTKVAPLKKLSIPRLELLGCVLLSKVLKDVLVTLKRRVSIDSAYCGSDSEVALCWVKGREECWKPWAENRVVSMRNIIDKDSWYHISGVNNPADIPTRVCRIDDFERWFDGPQFLYADIEISKFDVGARLKLVEAVVKNEAKGGRRDFKGVNSVNMLCSDFFDGSGHIALNVDRDFKEGSDVVFDVAAEHVNNLIIVLNSRTSNDVKVTVTIQNVIDIRRFSSLKKLIIITDFVIRFVNNLKGTLKNDNTNVLLENTLTIDEYKNALNL